MTRYMTREEAHRYWADTYQVSFTTGQHAQWFAAAVDAAGWELDEDTCTCPDATYGHFLHCGYYREED